MKLKKLLHVRFELNVNLDDVLTKIGVFGRWQQRTVLLLMIASFIGGLPVMNSSATVGMPKHFFCQIRDCHQRWAKPGQLNAYNWKNESEEKFTIDDDGVDVGPNVGPLPHRINYTVMCHVVDCEFLGLKTPEPCDQTHIYWTSDLPMNNSVLTMTESLCSNKYDMFKKNPMTYEVVLDVLYMAGKFLGGEVFIHVGKKYGRRFSLGLAMFVTLFGVSLGLFRSIWVYGVSRFVSGFGAYCCYLMAWYLVLETLKKDAKVFGDSCNITYFSLMANFLSIAYAVGEASTGLIAIIFHRYESFTMCVIVIVGASTLIIFFIPESPHWFIINGKRDEFLATMWNAAVQNRSQEPLTDLELLVPLPEPKKEDEKMSLWSPILLRPTLSLIFSWTSLATIYYGINFGVEAFMDLDEEKFHLDSIKTIAVVTLIEIPAYLANAFLMDIFGRKPIILFHAIVAAVSCIVLLGIRRNYLPFLLSTLLLKSAVSGALTMIRIYTIEFYPRTLKGKAFGLCKAISSFAAIFSALPLNHEILLGDSLLGSWKKHDIWEGCLCAALFLIITTGVLFIFLPDTIGFPEPRNLEDVKFMMGNSKPASEIILSGWTAPKYTKKGKE